METRYAWKTVNGNHTAWSGTLYWRQDQAEDALAAVIDQYHNKPDLPIVGTIHEVTISQPEWSDMFLNRIEVKPKKLRAIRALFARG
jgi:hypothetical protein